METNRRRMLRVSLAAAAALASPLTFQRSEGEQGVEAGETLAALPVYKVQDFGAKPDGKSTNTLAIQHTIDHAAGKGGGIVYFSPGQYLTGTLSLRDNVTLYLEAGATLLGSKHRRDYSRNSLIHAENIVNAAIRGRGTIDGDGTSFWHRVNRPSGGSQWVADKWRPEALANFIKCTNLLLEDVTFRNSPAWHIHPVSCDLVTIHGVSILAGIYENDGPNTDGIDPDACSRVRISDCYIQTGDDAIVLKCTNAASALGAKRECRDITITNCVLISSDAALKLGTETHGDFRNIVISNCAIRDAATGIELWMRDGGSIDGLVFNNIVMTLADGGEPIFMAQYPRERQPEDDSHRADEEKLLGSLKNVMISNVEANACGAIFLQGMMEKHLENITLTNIRLHVHAGRDKSNTSNANPPYPFLEWTKYTPYGIYCRYVDGLKLQDIQLTWDTPEDPDWGSAIRCRSVSDLEISGFTGRQSRGSGEAAIHFADVKNAFIHDCWAVEGTGNFLRLSDGSQNVSLMNNDLYRAQKAIALDVGVDARELFATSNRLSEGERLQQ